MGQRHQTFVIIHNPYKELKKSFDKVTKEEKANDINEYVKRKLELEQIKKELGTGAKTVLAFHHQWLYGATALAVVYNFLKFAQPKKNDEYSNPFNKNFTKIDAREKIELVTNLLRIHRFVDGFIGRPSGYEGFSYLNDDEPYMRELPFNGDNNDGISIIDTTTGKYCFMNMSFYSGSKIITQKNETPLTALEYLTCYYPQSINDLDKDDIKEIKALTGEEKVKKDEEFKANKEVHKKASEMFKEFELISLEELQKIFPKVFKKKEEEKAVNV